MSFFHRPGDSSSEDSSQEEDEIDDSINDVSQFSTKNSEGVVNEAVNDDFPPETLSLTNTISNGDSGPTTSIDEARNIMIASMLEELTKYKAAELLNNASSSGSRGFDKSSPEVQDLAKSLFAASSGVLNQGDLMSVESASEKNRPERARYLSALEQLSYQINADSARRSSGDRGRPDLIPSASTALVRRPSQGPTSFKAKPFGQFQQLTHELNNMAIVRRPSNELQFEPLRSPLRFHSHYHNTFEERGLLGRGGFGKVYHTYNLYDRKEYAIKKIPLSPKLSQRYHRGGLDELTHVLREVQALAQLEHCNVVRYHATWIEEPLAPRLTDNGSTSLLSHRGQKLLADQPATKSPPPTSNQDAKDPIVFNGPDFSSTGLPAIGRVISASSEDDLEGNNDSFDPFVRSSDHDGHSQLLWSHQEISEPTNGHEADTNLFSDGRSHGRSRRVSSLMEDPNVYILHVQMSMYPMTLADYLLPKHSRRRSSESGVARHCFHLVPALRLLLGILCGLQHIHSKGFVHRDIKPTNIFLSQFGFAPLLAFEQGFTDVGSCPRCPDPQARYLNPRIGDFGLVAELERAANSDILHYAEDISGSSNNAVGTEYYRAPAHKNMSDAPNEKTDVFALGVILLELLWPCSTRMERISLLKGAQNGDVPAGVRGKLTSEGFDSKVVDMTESCMFGMLDPDPRTRWGCGMIKNCLEKTLSLCLGTPWKDEPD